MTPQAYHHINLFSIPLLDGSGRSDWHMNINNECYPCSKFTVSGEPVFDSTHAAEIARRMFGMRGEATSQ